MATLIPAKQANKKTKENVKLEQNKILEEITFKINEAISKGNYYTHIYSHVDTGVVQHLRELGYRVDVHYDQRDGDLVTIYWN